MNAEYETILSLGVRAEIGGTGSQAIGADRFSTVQFRWALAPMRCAFAADHGVSFYIIFVSLSILLDQRVHYGSRQLSGLTP